MSAGGESTTPLVVMKTNTFANTGLTNGTMYFFKVAAVNAAGTGPMSTEGSAMPKSALPVAPTNLTATPGDSVITLKWNEVTGRDRVQRFPGNRGRRGVRDTCRHGTQDQYLCDFRTHQRNEVLLQSRGDQHDRAWRHVERSVRDTEARAAACADQPHRRSGR